METHHSHKSTLFENSRHETPGSFRLCRRTTSQQTDGIVAANNVLAAGNFSAPASSLNWRAAEFIVQRYPGEWRRVRGLHYFRLARQNRELGQEYKNGFIGLAE
jgi:hypothetical protein